MRRAVVVLSLVLSCGEGTAARPDDACEESRAQLLTQLERLIEDQSVAAGTPACGAGSVASGTASFGPTLAAAGVEQIISYFADHCAALESCD
jgi:hypothetical protein